jgi:hypothetical protein
MMLLLALAIAKAAHHTAALEFAKPVLRAARPTILAAATLLLSLGLIYSPNRYNLVTATPAQIQETELYDWIRERTSPMARLLTPPALQGFRIHARRAIVVDLKAVPYDRAQGLEWYRRLEAESGTNSPQNMSDVIDGYRTLDGKRLAALRRRYGITHAVVQSDAPTSSFSEWNEVFRNHSFVALEPRPGDPE